MIASWKMPQTCPPALPASETPIHPVGSPAEVGRVVDPTSAGSTFVRLGAAFRCAMREFTRRRSAAAGALITDLGRAVEGSRAHPVNEIGNGGNAGLANAGAVRCRIAGAACLLELLHQFRITWGRYSLGRSPRDRLTHWAFVPIGPGPLSGLLLAVARASVCWPSLGRLFWLPALKAPPRGGSDVPYFGAVCSTDGAKPVSEC